MANAQNQSYNRNPGDKQVDKQTQSEWSSRKVAPESDNRSSTRAHGSEDRSDEKE